MHSQHWAASPIAGQLPASIRPEIQSGPGIFIYYSASPSLILTKSSRPSSVLAFIVFFAKAHDTREISEDAGPCARDPGDLLVGASHLGISST